MHIVTGGAGFIGSNIAAALDARGEDVVVVDQLGHGDKWRNIAKRRLIAVVEPVGLFAFLQAHRRQIESVVHMGAISTTAERDVDLIIENNFRLSCSLWDWCAEVKAPFLYASSAATYGDGARGFRDSDDAEYLGGLRPLNPYGWSKHLFDRWAMDRVARGGAAPARWAGLKFFNVFGPNETHKGGQRSVAHQIFGAVRRGDPVKLFASDNPDYRDGEQLRDFVWVGDCVSVALWFLDGKRGNGLYNVGSGRARSFADLARAVFAAIGVEPAIQFVPLPETLKGKYQYFTEADMNKLAGIGYESVPTSLEVGVEKYVHGLLSDDPFV